MFVVQSLQVPCGYLLKEWNPTMGNWPHQLLWTTQNERFWCLHNMTDQLSQMAVTKRWCQIQAHHQNRGKQATETTPPPEPKGITGRDLKTINRAEEIMDDIGVQDSPENQFLAYMSVVSSNSIKAVLILVLLACFGGLALLLKLGIFTGAISLIHPYLSSIPGGIQSLLYLTMIPNRQEALGYHWMVL